MRIDKVILPFNCDLGPLATYTITAFPQNIFKPEAFFIPDLDVAKASLILGFQVGNQEFGFIRGNVKNREVFQGEGVSGLAFHAKVSGEVPTEFNWFKSTIDTGYPLDLFFPAVEVGQVVGVVVRNLTDEPLGFRGFFLGKTAR